MEEKNVPLNKNILSLWWWYIDETYNYDCIIKYTKEALSSFWYNILQYNISYWLEELRKEAVIFLKKYFLKKDFSYENIMITNWATAGIDLIWRYILKWKYDSVVFSPIYDTALESLKINSKKVYSIDINLLQKWNLFDIKRLEKILSKEDVKLLYVNPNFQNPTWLIFDEVSKKVIYNLCKKHNVIILEDDPYKIYNFDWLDLWQNLIERDLKFKHVIYLNSLSKVFFPWIRIWFILANTKYLTWISEIQKYTTSSPNVIMQWVAIKALQNWEIDKSIYHYFNSVKEKRNKIQKFFKNNWLLDENSAINFINSKWWFYFWWKFKDNKIDTKESLKIAYNMGISYIPWIIYFKNENIKNTFRLAYAQISIDDIDEALIRFLKFTYCLTK
jgi:2-aminoadipate transaminase